MGKLRLDISINRLPAIYNKCCLLCTLVAYIANNMDPDQIAPV